MRMTPIAEEPEKEEKEQEEKEENKDQSKHQCQIDKTKSVKNGLSRKEVAFVSECQDCKRTVKFIQTKGER
jgi:hypothetical protein